MLTAWSQIRLRSYRTKHEKIVEFLASDSIWLRPRLSSEAMAIIRKYSEQGFDDPDKARDAEREIRLLIPILVRFLSRCAKNSSDLIFVYEDLYDSDPEYGEEYDEYEDN